MLTSHNSVKADRPGLWDKPVTVNGSKTQITFSLAYAAVMRIPYFSIVSWYMNEDIVGLHSK